MVSLGVFDASTPGVPPSPCFPIFLARTTFVLESLPEAKNPGQDASSSSLQNTENSPRKGVLGHCQLALRVRLASQFPIQVDARPSPMAINAVPRHPQICQKPIVRSNLSLTESVWLRWCLQFAPGKCQVPFEPA